jgi:hypothetical protein
VIVEGTNSRILAVFEVLLGMVLSSEMANRKLGEGLALSGLELELELELEGEGERLKAERGMGLEQEQEQYARKGGGVDAEGMMAWESEVEERRLQLKGERQLRRRWIRHMIDVM